MYSSLLHSSASVTACTGVALLKRWHGVLLGILVFAGNSPEDVSNGGSVTHPCRNLMKVNSPKTHLTNHKFSTSFSHSSNTGSSPMPFGVGLTGCMTWWGRKDWFMK